MQRTIHFVEYYNQVRAHKKKVGTPWKTENYQLFVCFILLG